jgi:tetratricopeptide (TPR) repeat protein
MAVGYGIMAGTTNTARYAPALLDPEPKPQGGTGARRRDQPTPNEIRSYHQVGRMLLESAVRTGRKQAAAAAVEVFRGAVERVPYDASLRNGLGAALLERARLEPSIAAVATLEEATQAFQAASALAARQAAPRIVILRYEINAATVSWMLGERTEDSEYLDNAVHILQSASTELARSSVHWSHVQDNLGNALMALGRTEEAIRAYQAALDHRQDPIERGRALNNLGTAYAAQGHHALACQGYRDALALQPPDQVPLAWARTQHNLASALLQEALAGNQSRHAGKQLNQAIEAFEAARNLHRRADAPLDWSVTTANLAGAHLGLAAHLCARAARSDRRTGVDHIRRAIELYKDSLPELHKDSLPELPAADAAKVIQNIAVAVQMLRKASDSAQTGAEIRRHQAALLPLAQQHGLRDLADSLREDIRERHLVGSRQRRAAQTRVAGTVAPTAVLQWPTETYAHAHKARGENIVAFLSRVWLPLISVGVVDLRTLRERDPSAAKAVDNFTRTIDPVTGQRRRLPLQLHLPTKKELNDRLAASIDDPGDRPARLDWALRSRARRAGIRK